MKFKMNKKIAIVMAVIVLTMSIGSAVFAASGYKDLKAWYNNIKIFKNGIPVQLDFEPFIIDGYTYVPLRAVGELFNKDFDWDGVNYTINIKDRPDSNLNSMMKQIVEQQAKIVELEAKVKELETKTPTVSNLSDLEKKLNKDYGEYKNVVFDIDLYENRGNIEVRIYIDSYYDRTAWNKISSSNLKSYLQYIVDDILNKYKDAKVTGFIEDIETDKEIATFTTSSKGAVSVTTRSIGGGSSSSSIYDLEEELNSYFTGEYGIKEFIVDGDKYDIDLFIYVDYDVWKKLSSVDIRDIKYDIREYIVENYYDGNIYGEIIDYYDEFYIERF